MNTNFFTDTVNSITNFIGGAVANLFITAGVAFFLLAVVNFIRKRAMGAGGDAMNEAKNTLGWSIIALFVMFSIWGIITFLQSGLGFNKTQIEAPSVKVNANSSSNGSKKKAGESCTNDAECEGNACSQLFKKCI